MEQIETKLYPKHQKMKPYISFVAVARNDDHGGNFWERMQVFISALLQQIEKHNLNAELIIVDWNPPDDRPKLSQVLSSSFSSEHFKKIPCKIRIIEVPSEIHKQFQHFDKIALFQMIGKNVGIRRARGEFVVATNVDLLFSDDLIKSLASKSLEPEFFYRIDRYDVDGIPKGDSIEEKLDFCEHNLIRVHRKDGSFSKLSSGGIFLVKFKDSLQHFRKYILSNVRYGNSVIQSNFKEGCSIIQSNFKEGCSIIQSNFKEGCSIILGNYKEARSIIRDDFKESRSIILGNYKEARSIIRDDFKESRSIILGNYKEARSIIRDDFKESRSIIRDGFDEISSTFSSYTHWVKEIIHFYQKNRKNYNYSLPIKITKIVAKLIGGGVYIVTKQAGKGIYLVTKQAGKGVYIVTKQAGKGISLVARQAGKGAYVVTVQGVLGVYIVTVQVVLGVYIVTMQGGKGVSLVARQAGKGVSLVAKQAGKGVSLVAKQAGKGIYLVAKLTVRGIASPITKTSTRLKDMMSPSYPKLHTNGCGDFTMMSKEKWNNLRGYPEYEIFSFNIDSIILQMAYEDGLREKILKEPLKMYHMEHLSGWTPESSDNMIKRLEEKGIPFFSFEEFEELSSEMHKKKDPLISNKQDWGLGSETIPESSIN